MAYFLFVDESGTDGKSSPYEVLAGLAVDESQLWPLITAVHDAEVAFFGQRLSKEGTELKAKDLLKRKVFRHANQMPAFGPVERRAFANEALYEGALARKECRDSHHTRNQLTALAQAKLAFVEHVFELCAQRRCCAFASMVIRAAPRIATHTYLRKDYAFLLERFYNFLEAHRQNGFLILDELDSSLNTRLVSMMQEYFRDTATGRRRAMRIMPEPFIVHSELTTLVQVTDLQAYVLAWGMELDGRPCAREELRAMAQQVRAIGYQSRGRGRWRGKVHPFYVIHDLRPPEVARVEG